MSQATFYSDRTRQPRPRIREEIPANVWGGLVGLIVRRIDDGSLAREFPLRECPDSSSMITGTDRATFEAALGALIPELCTTTGLPHVEFDLTTLLDPRSAPPTPVALDVIDFVSHHIAEPTSRVLHSWGWQHQHHLFGEESAEQGQERFREEVELIFSRNGIAFTIGEDKKTARLGQPEVRGLLSELVTNTGDAHLDEFLRDAHTRFLSRHSQDRVVALERLWKAFERLKTLQVPTADKKTSTQQLIASAATDSLEFQARLNAEFGELTRIGNSFYIRHSEAKQQPLPSPIETTADYLFTRMLSLITYLLRQTGRMR